ncbi:RXT2-like protein [Lipomyces arxii]|uniref:RXT2-like protein n=1 Tax=Lipomyces arxii TaxID=56418 RepID=UPI0034CE097F
MVDQRIAEEIYRFKEALARPADASDSDSSIGAATSNRGRKLKRKARTVHEGKLGLFYGVGEHPQTVEYANKRRTVVSLKKHNRNGDESEDEYTNGEDPNEDYGYDEDDPYADIDLEAILSPIGHPSELPTHPGISRAYTRTTLSTLARRALDLICTEQKQLTQINRLLAAFLGDDPSYIRDHNLNLPEMYDHDGERMLSEIDANQNGTATGNGNGNGVANGKASAFADGVKSEQQEYNGNGANGRNENENQHEDSELKEATLHPTRRVTRNQSANEEEDFFALPKLEIDRDFGFPADTAQDIRQLAQMAAQRGEEVIRSLYKIRSGLLRADRFRAKVYKWCREVGGDVSDGDDESVIPT